MAVKLKSQTLQLHFRPPRGKGGIDPKHRVAGLGQPLTADIARYETQHFLSDWSVVLKYYSISQI